MVTKVNNPYSFKKTSSFQVYATTTAGYTIESQTSGGPTIQDTVAGPISSLEASVIPGNYIQNKSATYTF